jgi:hypothetical protein
LDVSFEVSFEDALVPALVDEGLPPFFGTVFCSVGSALEPVVLAATASIQQFQFSHKDSRSQGFSTLVVVVATDRNIVNSKQLSTCSDCLTH